MTRDIDALLDFLAERAATPFAWGRRRNDCIGFALAAARVATGRDLLPGVTWSSERGAGRVIRRLGGLRAAIDARLPAIVPAAALRGDWAAVPDAQFGISLMVVEGAMLVGPGPRGLKRRPRGDAIRAWSIDG